MVSFAAFLFIFTINMVMAFRMLGQGDVAGVVLSVCGGIVAACVLVRLCRLEEREKALKLESAPLKPQQTIIPLERLLS